MLLNAEVETLFTDFTVGSTSVDVAYLNYSGHNNNYIVYSQVDTTNSLAADDHIEGVGAVYDFDFYSKGNYTNIIAAAKALLESNNWVWLPNRDSPDFYDTETGLYHKTVCFGKLLQIT